MSFYRHVKFRYTFDIRSKKNKGAIIDEFSQLSPRPMDIDPIEFDSREEAYTIGGDLVKWAKEAADSIAESEILDMYPGPSPYAENIQTYVDDYDEADIIDKLYKPKPPKVPEYVQEQIKMLEKLAEEHERRAKQYREKIEELKKIWNID